MKKKKLIIYIKIFDIWYSQPQGKKFVALHHISFFFEARVVIFRKDTPNILFSDIKFCIFCPKPAGTQAVKMAANKIPGKKRDSDVLASKVGCKRALSFRFRPLALIFGI